MIGIRINSMKIVATTKQGEFGTSLNFIENGLNIIRAKNKSGKSTIINALLYVLGAEELLDGKNEGVMKPVLRESLKYGEREFPVIESKVMLQVSNAAGKTITITRFIKSYSKDSKLVEVVFGPNLTNPDSEYKQMNYYVHSQGSATEEFGFHRFLASFIGWRLPQVPSYNNDEDSLLYLQTIFPAFFKEQFYGWTNFYHFPITFGIKELSKRVTEFIMDLDVINNIREKDHLKSKIKQCEISWDSTRSEMFDLARHANIEIENLSISPRSTDTIEYGYYLDGKKRLNLEQAIIEMKKKTREEISEIRTIGEEETSLEGDIIVLEEELNMWQYVSKGILEDISLERSTKDDILFNIEKLKRDLRKNKESQKLYSYGALKSLSISIGQCPTCSQEIKDSLLPQTSTNQPMTFDENIKYIEEQLKTLNFGLIKTKEVIEKKSIQHRSIEELIRVGRKKIRQMKSELSQHPDLPSKSEIYNLVEDRVLLQRMEDIYDALIRRKTKLTDLYNNWKKSKEDEGKIPKDLLSVLDTEKLTYFETCIKEYLEKFGYGSVSISDIEISKDRYVPLVKGFRSKTDSSASDHIRMIWAYTISLFMTSKRFNGNHPNIMILDEPGQQQMDYESLKTLIRNLINLDGQIIIATSLEEDIVNESLEMQSTQKVRLIKFSDEKIIGKLPS